jgi:hypothetical protein
VTHVVVADCISTAFPEGSGIGGTPIPVPNTNPVSPEVDQNLKESVSPEYIAESPF